MTAQTDLPGRGSPAVPLKGVWMASELPQGPAPFPTLSPVSSLTSEHAFREPSHDVTLLRPVCTEAGTAPCDRSLGTAVNLDTYSPHSVMGRRYQARVLGAQGSQQSPPLRILAGPMQGAQRSHRCGQHVHLVPRGLRDDVTQCYVERVDVKACLSVHCSFHHHPHLQVTGTAATPPNPRKNPQPAPAGTLMRTEGSSLPPFDGRKRTQATSQLGEPIFPRPTSPLHVQN